MQVAIGLVDELPCCMAEPIKKQNIASQGKLFSEYGISHYLRIGLSPCSQTSLKSLTLSANQSMTFTGSRLAEARGTRSKKPQSPCTLLRPLPVLYPVSSGF